MTWWLYTTETSAIEAIAQLNDNIHTFNPSVNFADVPTPLTASPVINENTYLFGFPAPDENLRFGGVNFDLETEYSQDWFIQEEL